MPYAVGFTRGAFPAVVAFVVEDDYPPVVERQRAAPAVHAALPVDR